MDVPQTRLTPLGTTAPPPTSSFGTTPGFTPPTLGTTTAPPVAGLDPYATGPAAGVIQPTLGAPSPYGAAPYGSPYTGLPTQAPPVMGTPSMSGAMSGIPPIIPSSAYAGSSFAGPTYGAPAGYGGPSPIYPSGSPSTLFPSGIMGPTASYVPQVDPYDLVQRGRARYEYIYDGDSADDLSVNNIDLAMAFACQDFLWSKQPLFIAPSFSLHLWDGPDGSTGADLPSKTYSAFLDMSWQSDPNQIVGAELNLNFGAFSEFGVYNSNSFLVRGKGLAAFRLTPAATFKLGIYYYDRVDVKMLPAIGVLCRPNPFTRVDLFFPEPKYSRYLSTVGTQDVWWYVAGEYGGGSWTINRDDGRSDQFDYNDIRIMGGFEWGPSARMRAGIRSWHFDIGYAGDRKIVYRYNSQDNLNLDGTFLLRLGIGY